MLQIAATELEKEEGRREAEKQNYLSEHCPPLHLPGSMSEVQVPPWAPSLAWTGLPRVRRTSRVVRRVEAKRGVAHPPTHRGLRRQELCRQLHAKIDAAEEEKYDMEVKVQKSTKEVRRGGRVGPGGARGRRGGGTQPCCPPCSWRT